MTRGVYASFCATCGAMVDQTKDPAGTVDQYGQYQEGKYLCRDCRAPSPEDDEDPGLYSAEPGGEEP